MVAAQLFGQRAAVKFATPRGVPAMMNEARLLGGHLRHPGIVNALGTCFATDQPPAMAYELMVGGPLDRRITESDGTDNTSPRRKRPALPLSWRERTKVAFQVACALAYSHRQVTATKNPSP